MIFVKRKISWAVVIAALLSIVGCSQHDFVTIDFQKPIAKGSPYVFGGKQPRWLTDHQWDILASQGFTFMASQANVSDLCPCESPEDYKANKNGCADPRNWDWENGIYGENYIQKSIDRGMAVYMVYKNARWNRYPEAPEDEETMPRDLEVWGDILTKIINHYKGGIDFVACFNEIDRKQGGEYPQFYTIGSGYTRESGYKEVVKTALQAIEGSKYPDTPVGGPEAQKIGLEEAEWLLADEYIRERLGFISFHDFDNPDYPHEGVGNIKALLEKYQVDVPILRSSYTPEFNFHHPQAKPGTTKAEYVAIHVIGALKDGIAGSGLWEIQNRTDSTDHRYWFDGDETVETANFYQMGSLVLGLGKGPSDIFDVGGMDFSNGLGAINSDGEYIALFATTNESKSFELILNGVNTLSSNISIKFYYGDEQWGKGRPFKEIAVEVKNQSVRLMINIPESSVLGLKLK